MSDAVLPLIIGFLFGILLMVFLISGHEEEGLLVRVERAELSKRRPSPASANQEDPESERPSDRT